MAEKLISYDDRLYNLKEMTDIEVALLAMKVAKLVISNDSVWVCFENLLDKEHTLKLRYINVPKFEKNQFSLNLFPYVYVNG